MSFALCADGRSLNYVVRNKYHATHLYCQGSRTKGLARAPRAVSVNRESSFNKTTSFQENG